MTLRKRIPTRTVVPIKASYGAYKEDLRRDFAGRCGYCDGPDEFSGGFRGYQIDHFAPKSLFPEWLVKYGNLVYSCPYCNRAKSNKWVGVDKTVPNDGSSGFVDPCGPDLDNHLERDSQGRIVSRTPLGNYIVANLNLSLIRHQFVWQTQKMDDLLGELLSLMPQLSPETEHYRNVLEEIARVTREYREYRRRAYEA